MNPPEVVQALQALRHTTATLRLGLDTPRAPAARGALQEFLGQVDDYLLPRLRTLDAPLLAVVGGSTGSGKSTLVNTLLGDNVTRAGWLRPTTRGPVLVCHPRDVPWFTSDRVLPELPRSTGSRPTGDATLLVRGHTGLVPGLALLDAPDIDSVVEANRHLARQLLAAADLWIFCTTAARYADAVPWEFLRTAKHRGTALAVVLNRVPPEGTYEIAGHLTAMLEDNGLGGTTLFTLTETPLDSEDSRLPEESVVRVRSWLTGLALDAEARARVIRGTLDGALHSLRHRVAALAREAEEQAVTADLLRGEAERSHTSALRAVEAAVRDGSVLRGEVLARWQEFVGTGELTRTLERHVGRLRDRVTAVLSGRPTPPAALEQALESTLESLVRAAADRAAEHTVDAWAVRPAGRTLLAGRQSPLSRCSPDLPEVLRREIRAWQGEVLRLVAEGGARKRTVARWASLGTNGAGLVLMLAVFAHTGGLTGAEALVAGGTSAASQKVLEAVFGDTAVRALAARARADLLDRVQEILAEERDRFWRLVDAVAPEPGAPTELRTCLARFEQARCVFAASGRERTGVPSRAPGDGEGSS